MSPLQNIRWPPGRLGIAFSAGKDSTVLLALAKQQNPKCRVIALHINHLARSPESCKQEREAANNIAQQLDISILHRELNPNLKNEADWRDARYKALANLGRENQIDHIATAHHAKDQTETILMNFLRGTDLNGLKGMPQFFKRHHQSFFRPLLNIAPETLYEFLSLTSLNHFEDPSNAKNVFKRNRLRWEILPILEDFQPGCVKRIAELGSSINKNLEWQYQEYHEKTRDISANSLSESEVVFNRNSLIELPDPLLDIWCHKHLSQFAGGSGKITRQHVKICREFIKSERLGYLNKVFPGHFQLRGQKKKIIFKKL